VRLATWRRLNGELISIGRCWRALRRGDLYLFRGKRANRIKAIVWDRNGLASFYKPLEQGRYKWPAPDSASIELTEHELTLLLDGVDFTRIKRLPPFEMHVPPS
jgi:transposase